MSKGLKAFWLSFAAIILVCAIQPVLFVAASENAGYVTNTTPGDHVLTIVDETTDLTKTLTDDTTETYEPSSRKWNGIASVITAGDNVFVAWRTGGTREPSPFVYIVVAASDDGGKTFHDPFLIVDPTVDSAFLDIPMFYYNNEGRLWLTYRWFGSGSGEYAVEFVDPAGPLDEIRFTDPIMIGNPATSDPGGCFVPYAKPLLMGDGRILFGSSNYSDKQSTAVMESTDDGRSFHTVAQIPSGAGKYKTNGESSIVKLSDGTLWLLSRVEGGVEGGIEESFSYDGGKTWTNARGMLQAPLRGPGSRFTMINLQDGGLLFITNNSDSVRHNMTAYLSYDDGKTWPYSFVVDPHLSAYPDVWQAPDGKIYIVYDKGRYTEGGIRLTILTTDDLKAGKIVGEESFDKIVVTKCDPEWADIVSVETKLETSRSVKQGTSIDKIIKGLPTTLEVTDSNGKKHTLTGNWSSNSYNAGQNGRYAVQFQTVLPDKLVDSFNMLRVYVTVDGNGVNTGLAIGLGVGGGVIAAAVIVTVIIKLRKRGKNED